MPSFKLITNVSEFGLLRSLATSRPRLVVSNIIALAITYGAGLLLANYILEHSSSAIFNLLLITAMMMAVLVSSYLLTILLGDLFFPGPWRQRVILGHDVDHAPSSLEDHNAEFFILLFLCVLANAAALNWIAGDFFDRYHGGAYYKVALRAEAPEDRLAALTKIPDPMQHDSWDDPALAAAVMGAFDDPDVDVRKRAYWTAGFLQIDDARPRLLTLIRQSDQPAEQASAAIALSKFDAPRPEDVHAITDLLASSDHPAADIGALRALGLIQAQAQAQAPADLLIEHAHSDDRLVMIHAFWALRRIGGQDVLDFLHREIDEAPAGERRCAVFDAMKMVATPDDALWARRAYRDARTDDACEPVIWTDHGESQHFILWNDSFREKLLKIIANTTARENRDFFQRVVNDPDETWRIREVASEVLKQLDRAP